MMEVLYLDHRDEFIYWTMYEIDVRKYKNYKDDLKAFGNNAEEILLQVFTTCTWACDIMKRRNGCQTLWAQSSHYDDWEVPMIDDLTAAEYGDKCKE